MGSCIEFNDISYSAGGLSILSGVSGVVEAGDKFAIVGENGSGKSTLLSILLGDIATTSGEVFFGADKGTDIRSCKFGVVYDHMPLFPLLNIAELLNYIAALQHVRLTAAARTELLLRFNLQSIARRKVKVLSAGERQRVALMLSVVHAPDLLILDEAFSNVDPIFLEEIWQYVAQPARTVVFTSHNWGVIRAHATKILFLHKGKGLGDILSPDEHLRMAPSDRKMVATHSEELVRRLGVSSLPWYEQDGKINVFPRRHEEVEEIMEASSSSVESISLQDVFMLYKEGRI